MPQCFILLLNGLGSGSYCTLIPYGKVRSSISSHSMGGFEWEAREAFVSAKHIPATDEAVIVPETALGLVFV